jgi:PPM family protein phosphatase
MNTMTLRPDDSTGRHAIFTAPSDASPARVRVDFGGVSHIGKVRRNNEDHFLVGRLDRTFQPLLTNVASEAMPTEPSETVYGMLVADGMGGHAGGEIASRIAITTLLDLVLETPDIIMRLDPHFTEEALMRLDARFQRIREVLVEQVHRNPDLAGMGTTMTLACSAGADLLVAHVGDSRAYVCRKGELRRLTRDQTMAQFMADTGLITKDELATHPMRHILTGVLGTGGTSGDVVLGVEKLADEDQVLLCTDGLTEMVPEEAIAQILRESTRSAADVCERLVDIALEAGGKDNVTVVLGRYHILANR